MTLLKALSTVLPRRIDHFIDAERWRTDCFLSHIVMTKLGTVQGGPQPIQIAQQFAVPYVWAKRTGGPFLA
jgi:hypothetical protein